MKRVFIRTETDSEKSKIQISGPLDEKEASNLFQNAFRICRTVQRISTVKSRNCELFVCYDFDRKVQTVCCITDWNPKYPIALIGVSGIILFETRKSACELWWQKIERADGRSANSGKYFLSDYSELTAIISLSRPAARTIRFPIY